MTRKVRRVSTNSIQFDFIYFNSIQLISHGNEKIKKFSSAQSFVCFQGKNIVASVYGFLLHLSVLVMETFNTIFKPLSTIEFIEI